MIFIKTLIIYIMSIPQTRCQITPILNRAPVIFWIQQNSPIHQSFIPGFDQGFWLIIESHARAWLGDVWVVARLERVNIKHGIVWNFLSFTFSVLLWYLLINNKRLQYHLQHPLHLLNLLLILLYLLLLCFY